MIVNNGLKFNLAFIKLMDAEGGYVNDPDDPGGMTKYGISQRAHPDVDIKNLTIDGAKEIYRLEYWEKYKLWQIENYSLAQKVFLFCVNAGGKKGVKALQTAANVLGGHLDVDGILGPKTAGWVNSYRHQIALVAAYKTICNQYYISLGREKYIAGWLTRLEI